MKNSAYVFFQISVFSTIMLFTNINCLQAQNTSAENTNKNDGTKMTRQNIQIIPVKEMDSTPEIESFKFNDKFNNLKKDRILGKIKNYQEDIQKINLESISQWAKEKMKGYTLPKNFMETLISEKYYEDKNISVIKIKSIGLPSHNPLVKRFLYIIPVYNHDKDSIEKIFVTIQGFVEE